MSLHAAARQIVSVARVGIASIPRRMGASAVVMIGIAGVVGVLVGLLAMGEGFESTLKQTGTDDRVILLQTGVRSEPASALPPDAPAIVLQAPQIAKNAQGRPILSSELLVAAALRRKSTGREANIAVRGVGEQAWELRPQVEITSGRKFQTGLQELVVGMDAHRQFVGAQIGANLMLSGQAWTVVGIFDSGDAHNSEIWADTDVLGSAFRRGTSKNSITVQLSDADALGAFKAHLARDPRVKVEAQTTRQYYSGQSERVARLCRVFGISIAAIMALGAVFGALNTMYSAVATRTCEIATLRAIGFRSVAVILSVLLETMLLAMCGGLLGATTVWLLFDGFQASTVGAGGQIMFAFNVSAELLLTGVSVALAMGLVGGLPPAIRAARMPIATALREL